MPPRHISKKKTVVVLRSISPHDEEKQKQHCREIPMSSQEAEQNWQEDVFRVLKAHDVKHVVFVPDAGHSAAIRMSYADPDIKAVVLTTEEEGIGYLAGAWLGGERGALLMQSSGVGNCINTLALQNCAGFPLLMVVTMRGDWAEFNAWQNPMGQATEASLNLMKVMTWRADKPEDVAPLLHGAATMAFNGDAATALLLGQRLIGEKKWVK
jgi:sulfopyruvate decarboxylase alpha subunit